jgi:hypothetical protein
VLPLQSNVAGGTGADMATDPLWDAVGDLAVGTGPDAGARLAPNATATKKFLTETSSAAGWNVIAGTDQVYGTTAATACVGNDGRLSDSRTPLAHQMYVYEGLVL